MPIYEYQCERCGHRLEALQKISADPLTDCPECNQAALKKLVSAASFRLKGGGWYETDFKTGDKKQLADSDADNKGSKKKEDAASQSAASKPENAKSSNNDSASGSKSAKKDSPSKSAK